MKKHKYSTTIEVGDHYEFCEIIDGMSCVFFGVIITINKDTRTFDFERINYGKGRKKIPNGVIHRNISTVRGVGIIHEDTWK